jgi:hypothetical protein
MGIAVETPARSDISFVTNDDKVVGARWYAADGATVVPVTSAVMTLELDLPNDSTWPVDEAGEPIEPVPLMHRIDSTTPGDADGWIDAAGYPNGIIAVTVPHGIWSDATTRSGVWDLIATSSSGVQRCLLRGRFSVEEGLS